MLRCPRNASKSKSFSATFTRAPRSVRNHGVEVQDLGGLTIVSSYEKRRLGPSTIFYTVEAAADVLSLEPAALRARLRRAQRAVGRKSILVIDFRTRAGAPEAEPRRLMETAHATGSLELRAEAPTLKAFASDTFNPLCRSKFRAGTWRRYEGLLRQGLLDELGDKRVDAIGAAIVRAFMAELAKRGIQARGPVNLLRTILVAAVCRRRVWS